MVSSQPLPGLVAALRDDDILRLVGPAAFGQGLTYFRTGRVLGVDLNAERTRATGRVKGEGVTYTCWISAPAGRLDLRCACRVGADCKHAAAALLALREDARRAGGASTTWRDALRGLGGDEGAEGDGLALLVDAHDASSPVALTPLRRGAHTRWATRRASWSDLTNASWASVTEGLNRTHVAMLRDVYRLSRQNARWAAPNEVQLSALAPQGFAWLRRLQHAGVVLLSAHNPDLELQLAPTPWHLCLDVRADGQDLLASVAATDGTELAPRPRLEGDASPILVLGGGARLAELAPSPELQALAGPGKAARIPAADRAEFQTEWLPRVERHVDVLSSDNSFTPKRAEGPWIVGTVRLEDPDTVEVRWWVEYRLESSASRRPLQTVTDDAAARALREKVEDAAGGLDVDLGVPLTPLHALRFPAWLAPSFLKQVVGALRVPGLSWDVDPAVEAIRVQDRGVDVDAELFDMDSPDWFGLRVHLRVGDHEVKLADLLEAVARGEKYLRVDEQWVPLEGERLERLRELVTEARELGGGEHASLRISPLHKGLWDDVAELSQDAHASEGWSRRLRDMGLAEGPGLPVSHHTAAELRPYQQEGHRWLTTRATSGLGGILADDMGLGKTIQILSAIQSLRDAGETGPVLVVAPTSVVGTWKSEADRFFPALRVRTINATAARRDGGIDEIARDCDVLVTSYTLVRLEAEDYGKPSFSGLVLDEAQAIKNPTTAVHRAVQNVHARWHVAVTGTPMENSVTDLWSIFRVVVPGLFPSWKRFSDVFRRPIESGRDPEALGRLRRLTAPFLLRRTKEQVAPDLPDKVESVVDVQLSEEHRRIYDQYLTRERQRLLGLLDDFSRNRMNVLTSLTRLRQLALDPALVDPKYEDVGSAKIDLLLDQLDQIVPRGHQALVFSQFTSFLRRIRAALEQRGIAVAYLDGATRDRAGAIRSFRSGDRSVFLISLKAGGTGLTLTEADYVYVMDPWWNPAAEAQAVDRAHRIGQTKKVNVYRLSADDTIEQKVLALQGRKRELVGAVVDGQGASGSAITADDIRELLR